MRNAFIRGLTRLAEQDGRVLLLTADLGYKIFDGFAARFPGRFLNVGVAEAQMTGMAAGLSLGGFRPFTYSIVPFATLRCLEQIRVDVCYNNAAVTIVGVGGGYSYGPNGATHHGIEDIAVMRSLPNMTVVCPGDPVEAELAVLAAAAVDGPVYLRLGRAGDAVAHRQPPRLRIGEAITLRAGADCALISTGGILPVAMEAASLLEQEGLFCRVVSMHTVKPLDTETLADCRLESGRLFSLEEHSRIGGLGGAISEWLSSAGLSARLHCFGLDDRFVHCSGTQAYLRRLCGLTAEQVARTVLRRLGEWSAC